MKPWICTCLHQDGEIERRLFFWEDYNGDEQAAGQAAGQAALDFYELRVRSGRIVVATLVEPYASFPMHRFHRGW